MSLVFDSELISKSSKVLGLFLIPVGGGIPAGVLLGQSEGLSWQFTTLLYFISDVILACIFEPILLLIIAAGKNNEKIARMGAAFRKNFQKTIEFYGNNLGPFTLIMISFGADPMTGRTATMVAGHNFFFGWLLAITGDMIFYAIFMASTLWLNGIIGNTTTTTLIIIGLMIALPVVIKRIKKSKT